MAMIDVEQLIAEDHAARAIWELTGKVDLGAFYEGVRSRAGQAGRPVIDVRLLASLWIYGQSRGIHSARELEQLCQTDAAFQWLCGMEPVNYHTLSDFRVSHAAALEKLFVQVVGVLSHAGLVKLEQVMHDGTRIQACASGSSLRRQATVEQHMEARAAAVAGIRGGGGSRKYAASGSGAAARGPGAGASRRGGAPGTGEDPVRGQGTVAGARESDRPGGAGDETCGR
jgi:transposase